VPVVRDIPRFVSVESYAESFGVEWNIHSATQLDSHTGLLLSAERLSRCLGMPISELEGKLVFEPGCGAGRFTEVMVQAGALVHAIDLSVAVDANRRSVGARPNYVIAQADLLAPPFPREAFDVVVCLGVLQHTPCPEESIRALWSMVRPGGRLVFDHYTWTLSRVTKLSPLYRFLLTRISPVRAKQVTDRLVDLFFPLHWTVRRVPLAQMLLSRVSPCLAYCHIKAFEMLSRDQLRDWCRLETYDELTDRYKHLRTQGQLRHILTLLGAKEICLRRQGYVVEAACRKPSPVPAEDTEGEPLYATPARGA